MNRCPLARIVLVALITTAPVACSGYIVPPAGAANSSVTATAAEPFVWEGRLGPGETIEIKGVNGPIRAAPAVGDFAEVRAERTGRRNDPAEVRIAVVEHDTGVMICAVYPSRGRPNSCEPGSRGRISSRSNDVKVAFSVAVPDGVDLVARTTNGDVAADELSGRVIARTTNGDVQVGGSEAIDVRTTNGDIDIAAIDFAEAHTTNGSITVALEEGRGVEPLAFSTTNGSITLLLPDHLGADVEARTTNGRIRTDFPITVSGELSRRRLSAAINGGGRPLKLSTTNGGIHLKRPR